MKNILEKEIPFLSFKRKETKLYLTGLLITVVFALIYFITAVITKQPNFYSFFFQNIKKHFILMSLSIIHVGLLASGILIMIYAFYKMTLNLKCYNSEFAASIFLQDDKIIKYTDIKEIKTIVCFFNCNNQNKECRVVFDNPVYTFYMAYPVEGYFDDIEIFCKKEESDPTKRVTASRDEIASLLKYLKLHYKKQMPYLPEESQKK